MKSDNEIYELIKGDWTKTFKADFEDFRKPGTVFEERQNLKGEKMVIIWHVGEKTYVRFDPEIKDKIVEIENAAPDLNNYTLTGEHFSDFFCEGKSQVENIDHIFHLLPADFNPALVPEGYEYRLMTKDDKELLNELHSACTEEEIEAAYIEYDHEIINGIFKDGKLVSCSSVLDWNTFYDIGIITHPNHRKKGLAKAVVSKLVEEIFKTDKVPLYRCNITLWGSAGTAKSLGFKELKELPFKQEVLKLVKN